jgi:hypothetical protein
MGEFGAELSECPRSSMAGATLRMSQLGKNATLNQDPELHLLERFDGEVLVLQDLKQIQNADELQRLQRECCGIQQFQGATALLGGGQMADQYADTAGIDHGNLGEIEQETRFAGVQKILDGFVGAVQRWSDTELSAKLDDLHAILCANVDVHSVLPAPERP